MALILTKQQAFNVAARNAPHVTTGDTPLIIRVEAWTPDGFDHVPPDPTSVTGAAFLSAMRDAATKCLETWPDATLAYQSGGEIDLIFLASDDRRETPTVPLATRAASVVTAAFRGALDAVVKRQLSGDTSDADRDALTRLHDETVTFTATALTVTERDLVAYLVERQRAAHDATLKRLWRATEKRDRGDEWIFDNAALIRDRLRADYDTNVDNWPAWVTRGFVAHRLPSGAIVPDAAPPDFHARPGFVLNVVTPTPPTHLNCPVGELNEAVELDNRREPLENVPTRALQILHSRYDDETRSHASPGVNHHARAMYARAAARRAELAHELALRGIRVSGSGDNYNEE